MENINKKPNVVFILSDDQGAWTLGSYGNKEVISPCLDELAKNGVQFDNFYCTSPVCSPARASILTGKMPSEHGVVDWLGGGALDKEEYRGKEINLKSSLPYLSDPEKYDKDKIDIDETVGFEETTDFKNYMKYENGGIEFLKEHKSYTEFLANNGYNCGITGKWHLGDALNPQKGFDYWRVVPRGATYYTLAEYVKNKEISLETDYITDIITNDAISFIKEQNEEKPFYLSIHYTAPHDPWIKEEQPEEVWALYDECDFQSVPSIEKHEHQAPFVKYPLDEEERKYMMQGYYTCITAMDLNIRRIVEQLEEQNILDNTVIVFLADNGFNTGHHGIWGKGNGTVPLNMYESSVKVPLIISGKGIEENKKIKTLASQYDIFPTLLDICEIKTNEVTDYINKLPGTSLKPILSGEVEEIRKDVVIYDEYGSTRMIRNKTYKLVYRYVDGPHELYNLEEDPNEEINLIDHPKYQKIKYELFNQLKNWFRQYGAGKNDASLLPVDGRGQMNEISKYGTEDTVFLSF